MRRGRAMRHTENPVYTENPVSMVVSTTGRNQWTGHFSGQQASGEVGGGDAACRLVVVPFSPEGLECVRTCDPSRVSINPGQLPEDARPVGLWYDAYTDLFCVVLQSARFDSVPDGWQILRLPLVQFTCHAETGMPDQSLARLREFLDGAAASVRGDVCLEDVVILPVRYRQP